MRRERERLRGEEGRRAETGSDCHTNGSTRRHIRPRDRPTRVPGLKTEEVYKLYSSFRSMDIDNSNAITIDELFVFLNVKRSRMARGALSLPHTGRHAMTWSPADCM